MSIEQQIPRSARWLALAALVVGSVALAPRARGQDPQQQVPPAGERMDPRQLIDLRMARMTETLKLDSAQQEKVRWIISGETVDMEALRKNAGGQRAEGGGDGGGRGGGRRGGGGGGRRGGGGAPPDSTGGGSGGGGGSPEMRAIRDRTNKQIEALLNPQQLTTFRQLFEPGQQQPQPAGSPTPPAGSR
jgi:hypothetical protein